MTVKVSIIIPCFNVEEHVEAAVRSALAQTCADVEVVAVDDGSSDGTRAVIDRLAGEHRGRLIVIGQANRGACAARNAGISVTTGEWIQFLDADDVLLADKIIGQVLIGAGYDIVIGSYRNHYPDGRTAGAVEPIVGDPWEALVRTRMGTTSANLFRKSALLAAGGWNEDLQSSQDYELLFRMMKSGAHIAWDKTVGCEVLKRAQGSISRTDERANWLRYLDLRCGIRDHLRATDPVLHAAVIAVADQYLFRAIRVLSKHDHVAAQEAYARMLPKGFRPEQHTATTSAYLLAYHVLGFAGAERMAAILGGTRST